MTLPKRNLALRVIYSLSMVAMFVFLGWQALAYDIATPTAAISTANTAIPSAVQHPVVDKQPQRPMIHQHQALAISGLSAVLNLDEDLDSQINQLWLRFAYSPQAEQLPDSRKVYAVYTDYDRQRNQLRMTLGLAAGTQAESPASIVSGDYLSVADKTVLELWQQAGNIAHKQRFLSDYEIWTLDRQLQPVDVTAFVGMK